MSDHPHDSLEMSVRGSVAHTNRDSARNDLEMDLKKNDEPDSP